MAFEALPNAKPDVKLPADGITCSRRTRQTAPIDMDMGQGFGKRQQRLVEARWKMEDGGPNWSGIEPPL